MTPTLDQYLASYERDAAALVDAARGNLDARVPGCPEWDVRTLVQHTGDVLYIWGTRVSERHQGPTPVDIPDFPDDEAGLLAWFEECADRTHDILSAADPSTPMWTWADRKDVGFVQRRMPNELAIHSWDARSAGSETPAPIDPVIAVDGIDEFFDTFCTSYVGDDTAPPATAGTLHLHATDADGEWLVRFGPDGVTFSKEHAKGDAAVRGTASDLLLMLWRRVPTHAPSLDVHGDRDKLDAFVGWLDLS